MLLLAGAIVVIILSRKSDSRSGLRYAPVVRSQPIAPAPVTRPETFHRPTPSPRPARPVAREPRNSCAKIGDPRWRAQTQRCQMPAVPNLTVNPASPVAATDLPPLSANQSLAKTETLTEPTFSQPSANLPPVSPPAGLPEAKSMPDAALALPTFPAGPTLGPPDEAKPQPPSPESKPAMSDVKPEATEPPKPPELAVPPKPTVPTPGAANAKPEDITALAKTLEAAHTAIRNGEYDAAEAELKKVGLVAQAAGGSRQVRAIDAVGGLREEFPFRVGIGRCRIAPR